MIHYFHRANDALTGQILPGFEYGTVERKEDAPIGSEFFGSEKDLNAKIRNAKREDQDLEKSPEHLWPPLEGEPDDA